MMENYNYEKKIRIMIVDENSEFRTTAAANLRNAGFDVVLTVAEPKHAVDAIPMTRPDVILFDMILTGMDGVAFIQTAQPLCADIGTRFIATASAASEIMIREIMRAGAAYFLVKPVNFAVLSERIKQICTVTFRKEQPHPVYATVPAFSQEAEPAEDLEKQVTEAILEIGIPAHVKGYHYVRSAIMLAVTEPDVINAVTKIIYPTVAKQYKTSSSRVERAIRHAIEVAWDRGDVDTLNSIFGYSISSQRGKPTNSEFIAMIADRLRLRNKGRSRNEVSVI